jgi:crotonobetainyl-CoA:carnitine CoA-transferase CaiB-like acyl-CoA transferase
MTALEGVRVLDLTRLLPGAAATAWLANFGAEVIRIEPPAGEAVGDAFSAAALEVLEHLHRGKKSVVLDLKTEVGRSAFLQIIKRCDILVESFRPGVMARLGLGYDELRQQTSRLVYAAITGYGQNGPYRDVPGHDINYMALSGVLDCIGPKDGPPLIPRVQIADLAAGAMQAVIGILLALEARSRTGEGQFVDVSMTAGLEPLAAAARALGEPLSGALACYNVYRCADGRWLSIGALEPKFWANLCRAIGREDLVLQQYGPESMQLEMKRALANVIATRTAPEWFEALRDSGGCVAPVRRIGEVEDSDRCTPVLSMTPGRTGGAPVAPGASTREVLEWAGLSASEIDRVQNTARRRAQ